MTAPAVEIAPTDPLFAYLQAASGVVDAERLELDSPALTELRAAHIRAIVPLVAQGELIGALYLGPRLSDQEYSADDRKLLTTLAAQAAPAIRVAQLVREQAVEIEARERLEQEMRVATLIQQQFLPRELPQAARLAGGGLLRPGPRGRRRLLRLHPVARRPDRDRRRRRDRQGRPGGADHGPDPVRPPRRGTPAPVACEVLSGRTRSSCPRCRRGCSSPACTCVLEPATGRVEFANAGHNLPYVRTADGVIELRATGMPLGLLAGMEYAEREAVLAPGESVLLYSDGLVEAHGPAGDMFGFPKLRELMETERPGSELLDHLLDELHGFVGEGWEQEDDITLVALQRTGGYGWRSGADGDADGQSRPPPKPPPARSCSRSRCPASRATSARRWTSSPRPWPASAWSRRSWTGSRPPSARPR